MKLLNFIKTHAGLLVILGFILILAIIGFVYLNYNLS